MSDDKLRELRRRLGVSGKRERDTDGGNEQIATLPRGGGGDGRSADEEEIPQGDPGEETLELSSASLEVIEDIDEEEPAETVTVITEDVSEVQLGISDLIDLSTYTPGIEGGEAREAPAIPPERPVVLRALVESPAAEQSATVAWEVWEASRRFYLKEATAAAELQPERAALMWIEAARFAELSGADLSRVLSHLDAAADLCWESPHVLEPIRRTVLRLGDCDRALRLARRELELGGESATRPAQLVEMAALVLHKEQDAEQALLLLKQAAALQPGYAPALAMASGILLQLGRHAERADILRRLVESLNAPRERSLILFDLATTCEYRLKDHSAAQHAYARAIEADPGNLPAVIALCALLERTSGEPEALSRRLEHWAQLAGDVIAEGRLLMRAGLLYLERAGDLESAARCFAGAVRASPDDRSARQRLSEVYAATDRADDLIATLRHLLGQTLDGQGRAALYCRIGWLLHNRSHDLDGAIAAYRDALAVLPGYLPAVQALGTIFRQRGDYESLVDVNVAETEGAAEPAAVRASRYLENAEFLVDELGRADEAIEACRRALDLVPGMPAAVSQLQRLLEREERWGELAEVVGAEVERTTDDRTRHRLLLEMARLLAGPLGAADLAIEALVAARELSESRAASAELARLYEREGHIAELASLLLSEADEAQDSGEAQALRLRAAQLYDRQLDEPERALEVYRLVLERDQQCVVALRAAAQINHRAGRWLELIALHKYELESVEGVGAASLHCRIGRINEEELGDVDEAISAFRNALTADAGCILALEGLERLLRRERRWEDLLAVFERFAEGRTEAIARADALCRAAEIAELHLRDLPRAAKLYRAAQEVSPGFAQVQLGLLSVVLRKQDHQALAESLEEAAEEAASEETRAQWRLLRARWGEFFLGETPDVKRYQETAEAMAAGDRLREEISRVRRQTQAMDLPAWLHARASECSDAAFAAACAQEGAYLIEFGAGEDNLEHCRLAFEHRPDDPAVLWLLERAVWRRGLLAEAARLHEREAHHEADAAQKALRLAAAAATLLKAESPAEAARVAMASLEVDSRCLPALRLLCHLAEAKGDETALAELCDQLAAACSHRDNRLEMSRRAAELWADFVGDDGRAMRSLRFALATDPTDKDAFAAAEALCRKRDEFGELSRLIEQRIKVVRGEEQRDLLRRHANLLWRNLGQPNRAIAELKELLADSPDDEDALATLAELQANKEQWSDAAETLSALVERTPDKHRRHRALLHLAELFLHRLHDPQHAREALDRVLVASPEDVTAKQLLVELAVNAGDWDEARRMLEEISTEDDPQVRVWALGKLADVADIGLRDQELRRTYEMSALTEASPHRDVLEPLVESYWARRHQRRLLHLGEEIIRATTRADVIVPLRVLVARLLLEERVDTAHALELLRESLIARPNDEDVQLLFAQALEANGEDRAAIDGYRRLLECAVDCVSAHQGLARLFGRLDQVELAATASAILELFGAADADASVQARTLEEAATPPGKLALHQLSLPAEVRVLATLFEPLVPYLAEIYPQPVRQDPLPSSHPAAMACQRMAASLGLNGSRVVVGGVDVAVGVSGNPVTVQLAPQLAEAAGEARFRFWVGRALADALSGFGLLYRLGDDELSTILIAACTPRPLDSATQQLRKQLLRFLPRKLRRQLESEPVTSTSSGMWARYREASLTRIDEVGLLFCRSPRVAVDELIRVERLKDPLRETPRLAHLVRVALSDEMAVASRRLWSVPASP